MFVLIFCDFCGFISIAYTTLNKLLAVFYPRDAMLARVVVIATCLSVRPSVCHAPVFCPNEESQRHDFFTIW